MIAKITRGKGFRGALQYVLDVEHRPEIIGGNMAGRDVGELAREFTHVRQLRPDVEKPVVHVAIAFDPGAPGRPGDRPLSNRELSRIAAEYLRRAGHDPERVQWVAVRHSDRPHQHVHVILSRIRLDSTLAPQRWRDFARSKEICRELEQDPEYRLRGVRQTRPVGERAPTRGEDRMLRDRGMLSEKEHLKRLIQEAARNRPTMTEFVERLRRRGAQIRPNIARTGYVSGISYRLDRIAVKGSHLGHDYSWRGLQGSLGIRYDPRRDRPALERAAAATIGLRATRQSGGIFDLELQRLARRAIVSQIPGAGQAVRLLSAGGAVRRVLRQPSSKETLDLGLRLSGPGSAALARIASRLRPREPEYDPPVEREISFEPRRDDRDTEG